MSDTYDEKPGLLDRLLGVFSDIRAGEGRRAVLEGREEAKVYQPGSRSPALTSIS